MATAQTQTATVSKRRAFFVLLGDVHDDLPKDAVNQTVAVDNKFNAQRAVLVLRGSTADVEMLAKMVRVTTPKYKFPKLTLEFIPAELVDPK